MIIGRLIGKQLAENFEIHLIDQRNHGRSFHSDEFDYELLVEDLYNYIAHYNCKNNSFRAFNGREGSNAYLL